jgi:hypothetical protein
MHSMASTNFYNLVPTREAFLDLRPQSVEGLKQGELPAIPRTQISLVDLDFPAKFRKS